MNQDDYARRDFEESIGIGRKYIYDAKTGQPVSYELTFGNPIHKRPKPRPATGVTITRPRRALWRWLVSVLKAGESTTPGGV